MPVLALLLAAGLVQTPQTIPGTRYTFQVITDDDSSTGRVREDGRRARIDFQRDGSTDYVLVLDGGRRVASVHPRDGEYAETDASTFARAAAIGLRAVSATGVVRFRVRDQRVSSHRLGAGAPVAGLPTERFRMIQEFTVGVSPFGLPGETIHQVVVTDYWVNRSVRLVPNPIIDLVSTVTAILGQTDPEFTERSRAVRRELFTGTALRIVVTAHTLEEPGKVTAQRIEIAAIERDRFDRSLWDIPAGLRRRPGEFSWRF